jgi:HrpA-like RNA helicase
MPPTLLVPGSLRGDPGAVPIDSITTWLRKRMPEFSGPTPTVLSDRVIIAKSETGSGKSTVLPAHVFRLLRDVRAPASQKYLGRSVLCTQPRVLTAMSLARDMAMSPHYPDLKLPNLLSDERIAGTVGFQTGPISDMPQQGLIYATAGVLLAQLRAAASAGDFSEIAARFAFIIIDEAHERSLDIDPVLMLLKQFLLHGLSIGGRPAQMLPFIILASATISVDVYARYFNLIDPKTPGVPLESNVFHIVGRQHGIEERWPEVGTNDYIAEAGRVAAAIHCDNPEDQPAQCDILVFMPGLAETRKVTTALEKARDDGKLDCGGPVVILVINREAVNKETAAFVLVKAPIEMLWKTLAQEEIYSAEAIGAMREKGLTPRRIIVSTVVAETGLTIETLKYVIDGGWQRASESYHPFGVSGLITRPAPQSRIKQRKGRAGRLFPGVFYPLYTRKVFEALPPQQMPDIVTEGAFSIILDIILGQQISKTLSLPTSTTGVAAASRLCFRGEDIDMLDPPPADAFATAIELTVALGFFNDEAELLGRPPAEELVDAEPDVLGVGYGLTGLGRVAAQFSRLPLTMRRLLMAAPLWNCAVSDLATVIGVIQSCGDRGLSALLDPAVRRRAMAAEREGGPTLDAAARGAFARVIPEGASPQLLFGSGATKKLRSVAQDDLIEGLWIFDAYRAALETAFQGDRVLAAMEEWCVERHLDSEALVSIAAARETAIEEMIPAGLNPFWGEEYRLRAATRDSLASRIQGLKRCFHDAFRLNTLAPRVSERTRRELHVNRFGLTVACPTLALLGGEGAHVVAPTVSIVPFRPQASEGRPGTLPLRWALQAALVSVLETRSPETRVAPDPDLLSPKDPAPK